jgi:hypothetical protein
VNLSNHDLGSLKNSLTIKIPTCRYPHIKEMGVTVLPEIEEAEDGETKPEMLPEQTEKGPAKLSVAERDRNVRGMPAWTPLRASCSLTVKNQPAGVQSTLWPGAVAVTDGQIWMNIYVGWGLKREKPYSFPSPPRMQEERLLPLECNDLPPPPAPKDDDEDD